MVSIIYTPTFTIYNTEKKIKKDTKHWRQYSTKTSERPRMNLTMTPPPKTLTRDRVVELEMEVEEYKRVNTKLKLLVGWNVRAAHSALKSSQDIIEIIENLDKKEAVAETRESILD